ncbi:hypothetical protein BU15DRAFT_38971 [Melanogaster broomeanus]|nr:hypothetical protein BU15DRAFT_38971 [Melanogaster broomeanus]
MSTVGGFGVPQPYSPPSGGQIQPGAITYTTTTGPDGQVIYHPFNYQTPQGVVHGIQWVPAEATQILPAGAMPANAEFAASWNRLPLTKEDEKDLDKWQRSEEKRRKKEEKESLRRLTKQFDKDMEETEFRARDVQARERRRSFYGDAPPPVGYGVPGSAAYGGFTHSPSSRSTADLDRKFNELEIEREAKQNSHLRKYPTGGGDRASGYYASSNVYSSQVATSYQSSTGYPTTAPGTIRTASPSMYSTSPRPHDAYADPISRAASPYARQESIARASSPYGRPEPIARAASPYGRPEPIARAASPYGRPEPIARAASPYGRPEPIARAASPYGRPEPIARAASPYGRPPGEPVAGVTSSYAPSHSPYGARAPSPLPPRAPSPYARGPMPQRSTSPFPRAPSPYVPPQANYGVYPPGHVLEGQPLPRSRAPSPMPGPPGVVFPSSPRMPGTAVHGDQQQLSAPEAFSRPANAAQPYTAFHVMRIQDMEQFYDQIPRMPLVLDTHDVYHQDWIRFMNDLALAWAGKMPIPEFSRGPPPKRSVLVADLIDLWNSNFFLTRRVEVVLYKGRERRSGPNTGTIDYHLPGFDDSSSDDSSLSSSESDSDSDRYAGYGRGVDLTDSRRRRKEKEEKKRRKKEKKLRKKAKEREKTYALYLTYVPPRDLPGPTQHGYYA